MRKLAMQYTAAKWAADTYQSNLQGNPQSIPCLRGKLKACLAGRPDPLDAADALGAAVAPNLTKSSSLCHSSLCHSTTLLGGLLGSGTGVPRFAAGGLLGSGTGVLGSGTGVPSIAASAHDALLGGMLGSGTGALFSGCAQDALLGGMLGSGTGVPCLAACMHNTPCLALA